MHVLDKKKRFYAYVLNLGLFIITFPFRFLRKKRAADLESPKILISRPDHIGDVLLSTPVYHSLKEKFPKSKIILVCGSWSKTVVGGNPFIDEVWTIDCPWWTGIRKDGASQKESFYKSYRNLLSKIRQQNFDIFIELRGDVRHTFLFGWVPNIPIRIANDRSGAGFLLTHSVPFNFQLHEIEKNYALLEMFEPINKYQKTEFYTEDSDAVILGAYAIKERYAVVFNGGRSPLRRLGEFQMVDLIRGLKEKFGLQCIMVGSKEDAESASRIDKIINQENTFLNLCGLLPLPAVRELIKKAVLFVGNDSSISHVAASTFTPSISLYGPMLPDQVNPLGEEKKVVYHKYPCSPCLQTKCLVTGSFSKAQCILEIKVEEILALVPGLSEEYKVTI